VGRTGIPQDIGEPGQAGKIGILLINLGTPDGPQFWQVRREDLSAQKAISEIALKDSF
jgi:hypothetical protein